MASVQMKLRVVVEKRPLVLVTVQIELTYVSLLRSIECIEPVSLILFLPQPRFHLNLRYGYSLLINNLHDDTELFFYSDVHVERQIFCSYPLQQQEHTLTASNQTHVLSFIMAHAYETQKLSGPALHFTLTRMGLKLVQNL